MRESNPVLFFLPRRPSSSRADFSYLEDRRLLEISLLQEIKNFCISLFSEGVLSKILMGHSFLLPLLALLRLNSRGSLHYYPLDCQAQ